MFVAIVLPWRNSRINDDDDRRERKHQIDRDPSHRIEWKHVHHQSSANLQTNPDDRLKKNNIPLPISVLAESLFAKSRAYAV